MIANCQKEHILVHKDGLDFYSVNGLEVIHKEMLRLLGIIDEICSINNLNYWLDGGSLIGAVRHHGFIPWDDDLDISLLKDDYIELINRLGEYSDLNKDAILFYRSPQNYHCCNYFSSVGVYYRIPGSYILYPVKIDIRPLNAYRKTKGEKEENLRLRDIANSILFNKHSNYSRIEDIPHSISDIKKFFMFYNKYGVIDRECSSEFLLSHPYFEFSNNFPLELNQIYPIRYVDFEDIKVPIPKDTDFILTKLYGNYMELPPLKNRAPVSCEVLIKDKVTFSECERNVHCLSTPVVGIFQKILRRYFLIRFVGFTKFIKILLYE